MSGGPARLRLSRRKDFNLQQLSQALNGLPAVNVSRPSRWGNPFAAAKMPGGAPEAVARFRQEIASDPLFRERARAALRDKNLACWCAPDQPCHADVLLEILTKENRRRRKDDAARRQD